MIKWPFLPKDAGLDIVKTEGAYLYARQGHKILDAASGAIVNNIGYGREEVAEAIKKAALNNTYVLPPFLTPEREELLDELRKHWLPSHLTLVYIYLLEDQKQMNLRLRWRFNIKRAEGNLKKI